jgi:hypothetical protein
VLRWREPRPGRGPRAARADIRRSSMRAWAQPTRLRAERRGARVAGRWPRRERGAAVRGRAGEHPRAMAASRRRRCSSSSPSGCCSTCRPGAPGARRARSRGRGGDCGRSRRCGWRPPLASDGSRPPPSSTRWWRRRSRRSCSTARRSRAASTARTRSCAGDSPRTRRSCAASPVRS